MTQSLTLKPGYVISATDVWPRTIRRFAVDSHGSMRVSVGPLTHITVDPQDPNERTLLERKPSSVTMGLHDSINMPAFVTGRVAEITELDDGRCEVRVDGARRGSKVFYVHRSRETVPRFRDQPLETRRTIRNMWFLSAGLLGVAILYGSSLFETFFG